jgi:hypothetical protein
VATGIRRLAIIGDEEAVGVLSARRVDSVPVGEAWS